MYHFIPISLVDCNEQVADPVFCFRYHASRKKRVELKISSDGNMMQHLKDEKSPFFGLKTVHPPWTRFLEGYFVHKSPPGKEPLNAGACLRFKDRHGWMTEDVVEIVFVGEHETAKHFMDFNLQLNKVPQNWKGPKNNIWTKIPLWAPKKQISISLYMFHSKVMSSLIHCRFQESMAPCDRSLALPSGSRAFELVVVGSLEIPSLRCWKMDVSRNGIYI